MEVDRKITMKIDFTIKLDEVEASDLRKMLDRINNRPNVGKSEFSLREKKLATALSLHLRQHIEPQPDENNPFHEILVSGNGWLCTCGTSESTITGGEAQRHGYLHGTTHKPCVLKDLRHDPIRQSFIS